MKKPISLFFSLIFFFIVKVGNTQILWENQFQENGASIGYDIIPTLDNGYMITGFCNPSNTLIGQDFLFLKIDSIGQLDWAANYGMNSSDIAKGIVQVYDSGFVACGFGSTQANSSNDIYLVKVDQHGGFVWEKTYGGLLGDMANDIAYSPSDSSILIVGSKGNNDWLLKLDKNGDSLWSRTYSDSAVFESIITTSDGGILMTGEEYRLSGFYGFVVKTDNMGLIEWVKYFEGGAENIKDCREISPNQYLVCGYSQQDLGSLLYDGIIRRLDSDGSQIWYKTYGGPRSDYIRSMVIGEQGEFIFTGTKNTLTSNSNDQQVYLLKTDTIGELIWECQIGNNSLFDDSDENAHSICKALDIGYILAGTVSTPNGVGVYVVKIGENGNTTFLNEFTIKNDVNIFPNPASETLTISLPENTSITDCILVDNAGKEVQRFTISGGENVVDVSELESGIYFIQIYAQITKLIKN